MITPFDQYLPRARAQMGRCCAAAAAIAVEALLRASSLPRICRLLGVELSMGEPLTFPHRASSVEHIDRVRRDVEWAYSRLGLPDTCLRRALTAGFCLRAYQPRLVIGVRKSASLDAHAWLVASGSIIDWAETHGQYLPMR